MELSTIDYYFTPINNTLTIQIPQTCPYCGIGNNPTNNEAGHLKTAEGYIFSMHHRCPSCKKIHMSSQEYTGNSETTMLLVYPNRVIENIDSLFITHAPNFVQMYSEAIQAEKDGLTKIAGMGYRLSIECLIKDYALDFGLDKEENIAKQNFNNSIDRYMKEDELLKGSIHVVRKIGNDYSHWKKEYDLPFATLKAYVEIVIQAFKIKFMMKYPPI